MKRAILFFGLLSTFTAFADVGNGVQVMCGNGQSTLMIYETAVGSFNGQLRISGAEIDLNCRKTNVVPTNHYSIWTCSEARAGRERYLAVVEEGGIVANMTAVISQESFGGEINILASLVCN